MKKAVQAAQYCWVARSGLQAGREHTDHFLEQRMRCGIRHDWNQHVVVQAESVEGQRLGGRADDRYQPDCARVRGVPARVEGRRCEEAAALQRTSSVSAPLWKMRTLRSPSRAAPDGTPTTQIRTRLKIAPNVTNAAEPAQLLSLFQPSRAILPHREPTTSAMPSPPHSCPTATSAAVVPCGGECEVGGQVAGLCAALL